jgi:hypothetical protein
VAVSQLSVGPGLLDSGFPVTWGRIQRLRRPGRAIAEELLRRHKDAGVFRRRFAR